MLNVNNILEKSVSIFGPRPYLSNKL